MRGPWPEASQADVTIDGVPYRIDRLADIAWLRTAQFMRGIEIKCNLDRVERLLRRKGSREEAENIRLPAYR